MPHICVCSSNITYLLTCTKISHIYRHIQKYHICIDVLCIYVRVTARHLIYACVCLIYAYVYTWISHMYWRIMYLCTCNSKTPYIRVCMPYIRVCMPYIRVCMYVCTCNSNAPHICVCMYVCMYVRVIARPLLLDLRPRVAIREHNMCVCVCLLHPLLSLLLVIL